MRGIVLSLFLLLGLGAHSSTTAADVQQVKEAISKQIQSIAGMRGTIIMKIGKDPGETLRIEFVANQKQYKYLLYKGTQSQPCRALLNDGKNISGFEDDWGYVNRPPTAYDKYGFFKLNPLNLAYSVHDIPLSRYTFVPTSSPETVKPGHGLVGYEQIYTICLIDETAKGNPSLMQFDAVARMGRWSYLRERIWLDKAHGYIIARSESEESPEKFQLDYEVMDYGLVEGFWYPHKCMKSLNGTMAEVTIDISEINKPTPAGEWEIAFPAGLKSIHDYRVDADLGRNLPEMGETEKNFLDSIVIAKRPEKQSAAAASTQSMQLASPKPAVSPEPTPSSNAPESPSPSSGGASVWQKAFLWTAIALLIILSVSAGVWIYLSRRNHG
jgi:hypothetical protein